MNMASRKDEFIVARDKITEIQDMKLKIERMFGVEVGWGAVAKVETGLRQWIHLSGDGGDKRNAKEYIVALCHPDVKQNMQFPASIMEDDLLEPIEKQSNAVIKKYVSGSDLNTHELEIAGTDIAVTIALSLLDCLLQEQICKDGDTNNLSTRWGESLASQRLQDGLQRALSQHSDGGCNAEDYSLAPDSVKRVILQCLKNESLQLSDENALFGADIELEGRTPLYQDESKRLQIYNQSRALPSVVEADVVYPDVPVSWSKNVVVDQVDGITQQLTDANLSTCSKSISRIKDNDFLKKYGRSVGYSEREVMEALNFVDENTRPSDFLQLLTTVKSQLGQKEEEMKNKTEKNNVELLTEQQKCAASSTSLQRNNGLPREYRLKLIQDMAEEGEHSSVEDLKRRNQDRQQRLSRAFQDLEKAQKTEKLKIISPANSEMCGEEYKNYFDTDVSDKNNEPVLKNKYDAPSNKYYAKHKYTNSKPQKQSKKGRMLGKPTFCSAHPDEEETCVMKLWTSKEAARNDPHTDTQVVCSRPQRQINPRKPFTAPIATRTESVDGRVPRYVVIDGSNVAMTHGNGKIFSCKALRICVDYFLQRGHKEITVFVPVWRTYKPMPDKPISYQNILMELKEEGYLIFTPGRRLSNRKTISCYDDRFVLDLAEKVDGIVVSLDHYRDLKQENKCWQELVDERLLMYCFVGDHFMPTYDPLGRDGPNLTDFLLKPPDKSSPSQIRYF